MGIKWVLNGYQMGIIKHWTGIKWVSSSIERVSNGYQQVSKGYRKGIEWVSKEYQTGIKWVSNEDHPRITWVSNEGRTRIARGLHEYQTSIKWVSHKDRICHLRDAWLYGTPRWVLAQTRQEACDRLETTVMRLSGTRENKQTNPRFLNPIIVLGIQKTQYWANLSLQRPWFSHSNYRTVSPY
jgi:hypothetical protein